MSVKAVGSFDCYCSVTEAAGIAGVSPAYIRAMAANGQIRAEKIGRSWAVLREDVGRFVRIGRGPARLPSKHFYLGVSTYFASLSIREAEHKETHDRDRRVRVVPSERWYVLGRDKETCVYCGWSRGRSYGRPDEIHVDHIFPFSRGGSPTRENLVCACSRCNLYKGDRTPEEAGMEMLFLDQSLEYAFGSIFQSLKGG